MVTEGKNKKQRQEHLTEGSHGNNAMFWILDMQQPTKTAPETSQIP